MTQKLSHILRYLQIIEALTEDQKRLVFAIAIKPGVYCHSLKWQRIMSLEPGLVDRELPGLLKQKIIIMQSATDKTYFLNCAELEEIMRTLGPNPTRRDFAAFFMRTRTNSISISTTKVITSSQYLREPKPAGGSSSQVKPPATGTAKNNVIRGPWGSFDQADIDREFEKVARILEAEREGRDWNEDEEY